MEKKVINTLPSVEEIDKAIAVIHNLWRHFYDLLYNQQPRLTSPGLGTMRPFDVSFSQEHSSIATPCLRFQYTGLVCENASEFYFVICVTSPQVTAEELDADVLQRCNLILDAVKAKAVKEDRNACCALATSRPCVCTYSCTCPLHGLRCVGTHD